MESSPSRSSDGEESRSRWRIRSRWGRGFGRRRSFSEITRTEITELGDEVLYGCGGTSGMSPAEARCITEDLMRRDNIPPPTATERSDEERCIEEASSSVRRYRLTRRFSSITEFNVSDNNSKGSQEEETSANAPSNWRGRGAANTTQVMELMNRRVIRENRESQVRQLLESLSVFPLEIYRVVNLDDVVKTDLLGLLTCLISAHVDTFSEKSDNNTFPNSSNNEVEIPASSLYEIMDIWGRELLESILVSVNLQESQSTAFLKMYNLRKDIEEAGGSTNALPFNRDGFQQALLRYLDQQTYQTVKVFKDLRMKKSAEEEDDSRNHSQSSSSLDAPTFSQVLFRDFLVLLVSRTGRFDAAVHCVLRDLGNTMGVQEDVLCRLEEELGEQISAHLQSAKDNKSSSTLSKNRKARMQRGMKIAGAALGSGVLLAVTGGLAAPTLVAGWGALGITSAFGTFLASSGGTALVASTFGVSGAGLTSWKVSRRIGLVKEFDFELLRGGRSLHVIVGISGWLESISDVTEPWNNAFSNAAADVYALRWETKELLALGSLLVNMLAQELAAQAAQYWLKATLVGVAASVPLACPIALLKFTSNLDNAWLICRQRSHQAGFLLADAISATAIVGQRPVTLVGWSMGARVIFHALQKLYERKKLNCVCHVVLIGLPSSPATNAWRRARKVASGRFVNVYNSSDWLLGFLYRYMEWGIKVAGLHRVEDVEGVENLDVKGIVKSHDQYPIRISEIMTLVDLPLA